MSEYYDPFQEDDGRFDEFFSRVDSRMCQNLKNCEAYQNLIHSCSELKIAYPDIASIVESYKAEQKEFSQEEMEALAKCMNYTSQINNYISYEMYKIGFKECIILFQMLGIL